MISLEGGSSQIQGSICGTMNFRRQSKLWNTQFLSFYDGDIPCGFIYFAVNRKMIFIMFLAVDEELGYRKENINE